MFLEKKEGQKERKVRIYREEERERAKDHEREREYGREDRLRAR